MDALDVSEWMNEEDDDDESDYVIENIEITKPSSLLKKSLSEASLCSDRDNASSSVAADVPSLALDSLDETDSIVLVSIDDDDNIVFEQRNNLVTPEQSQQLRHRRKPNIIGSIYNRQLTKWRIASKRRERKTWWLISANHRLKILWDICTVLLSFASLYATHQAIRDRRYEPNMFHSFCNTWFFLDMLLNFFTEHRSSDGSVISDGRAVWARYLTSWFVVDTLSLVPWERIFVKPIIEMQNRRGFFKKLFFRSRSVVRVSRKLRGNHFRLFGRIANQTKHVGVGSRGLLRLIIKYAPKYVLFFRNMRGVLAVRMLRQIHWIRKLFKNIYVTSSTSRPVKSLRRVSSLVNRENIASFLTPPRRLRQIRRRSIRSTSAPSNSSSYDEYDHLGDIHEDECDYYDDDSDSNVKDVHTVARGNIVMTPSPTKLD